MSERVDPDNEMEEVLPVSGMYKNWFLDYASYVILDRAVPYIEDGLKPVQRRILHAMKEMDDGRFNKVANIIGQTMQYHPHGDLSIGDATVKLGQKDLLIETQGNWGNTFTGDGAAAPRYIEARLSKFALEVAFNAKTTNWQMSYDGRKNEPVTLPVKFPLVLAQGVEGIAVGLSTKVMPHNFCELCEASIAHLRGKSFKLYPDFQSGGMVDVENYNWGKRGGKIRSRARIAELDKKSLVITELPYGQTTQSVIDSIIKANDRNKIKIRKIDDNTAATVEIVVTLPTGINPAIATDALYAFTNCEVSISPNCCIIVDDHPVFTDVRTVLKQSTDKTVALLKLELEIRKRELEEKWHMSSLEKIFIENRIYRDIEEEETWDGVIEAIDRGLDPFKKLLMRDVTRDDIVRLTEIRIKRISKFDSFKADEFIRGLEEELKKVEFNLANLVDYSVDYFTHLLKKYGENRERKTEIRTFDNINATQVVIANQKLYVNAKDGFVGTGLKKDEFVSECSDIDDVIVFLANGAMKVVRVSDKVFIGKNIIHVNVWRKGDQRTTYHLLYRDSVDKRTYAKRFHVKSITRDREYFLTKSGKAGKVYHFSENPNGESEIVTVRMKPGNNLRKKVFDQDFAELGIKGRTAGGNLVTKHPVSKVEFKSKGFSTLPGMKIWYDETVRRLNTDEVGELLGSFKSDDKILLLYPDGSYELTSFELTNRYEGRGRIHEMVKFTPEMVVSAIHQDTTSGRYYIKRFFIETTKLDQKYSFLPESEHAKLIFATVKPEPVVLLKYSKKTVEDEELDMAAYIDVKGWKATGNKLTDEKLRKVEMIRFKEPEVEVLQEAGATEKDTEFTAKDPKDIPFEFVDKRDNKNDEEDQPTLF
ncbi:MAG TPA: DNA gyrase/topoisomerase IV subunit A [Bacteroidetes bacterium]|nr:DNA gyrase/topoisomerase IV subunit A [Bacteroidota bacterium]